MTDIHFADTREIGRVRSSGTTGSNRIVVLSDPQGPRAEAIWALRTHLLAQHVKQGRRGLAICGPSRDVGCSFVAANLAVAMSQIGINTLLIDADLRSPGLQDLLPYPNMGGGLQGYLASSYQAPDEAIELDVLPNLSMIYAGAAAANPQDLLGGDRFKALMSYCLREFDLTIVDTPAANTSSDVRRIASLVGYGMIVARKNRSLVHDVRALVDELQGDQAGVIGSVLNEA